MLQQVYICTCGRFASARRDGSLPGGWSPDADQHLCEDCCPPRTLPAIDVDTGVGFADPRALIRLTATYFGLPVSRMIGKRRTAGLVWARQITAVILRRHTALSLLEIAKLLGYRDHTTVIHALEKVAGRMGESSVHETLRFLHTAATATEARLPPA